MEVAAHLPTAVPCFSSPQQVLTTRADLAVMMMRGAASVQRKIERKARNSAEQNAANAKGGVRRRLKNVSVDELKRMLKPGKTGEAMMPSFME